MSLSPTSWLLNGNQVSTGSTIDLALTLAMPDVITCEQTIMGPLPPIQHPPVSPWTIKSGSQQCCYYTVSSVTTSTVDLCKYRNGRRWKSLHQPMDLRTDT